MNRRNFLTKILGTSAFFYLAKSQAQSLGISPKFNEIIDVDQGDLNQGMDLAEILDARAQFSQGDGLMNAAVPQDLWTFEQVMPMLSPFLETSFDAFVIVNTAIVPRTQEFDWVPAQRMQVVQRKGPGPVFERTNGVVSGVDKENSVSWDLIPVSTGPGRPYILTYSGIFRFNHERSKSHHYTHPDAGMSYSTYLDFEYDTGRESGLAIHGTPNRSTVGKERDSQGCVAVYFEDAKKINEFLMSPSMWSNKIPAFNRRRRQPTLIPGVAGVPATRPGINALFVIFNGYRNPKTEA